MLNLRVRHSLFPERKSCPLFEKPALLLAGSGLFKDVISARPSFPRYPGTGPYGVVLGESRVEPSAPPDAVVSSFPPRGWPRRAPWLRVRERLGSRRRRHVVARGEVGRAPTPRPFCGSHHARGACRQDAGKSTSEALRDGAGTAGQSGNTKLEAPQTWLSLHIGQRRNYPLITIFYLVCLRKFYCHLASCSFLLLPKPLSD